MTGAEVVAREAREPRFLGDMPHGWVASDHIRSVLDLFAYEDESERSLILAAGVPMAWFRGKGLSIRSLRTPTDYSPGPPATMLTARSTSACPASVHFRAVA